ncbi:DUF5320 domain-containing protein [Candidatus Solincola sp.]|nr:DUF5320 domain-containing protein [Actinomycetota bacterium]
MNRMPGYGYRNMYRLTGLPGWMRFGYSPGWVGRSPSGLGPCAEYLVTGRWPTPQTAQAWQAGPASGFAAGTGFAGGPEQELEFLKSRADFLSRQLDAIRKRIEELEKK